MLVQVPNFRYIDYPNIRTFINGVYVPQAIAVNITYNSFPSAPDTAIIEFPQWKFDDSRIKNFKDAKIEISINNVTVFAGFVQSIMGSLSSGTDRPVINATSIRGFFFKVFVGQEQGSNIVEFTNIRPSAVMRTIYNQLPSSWKSSFSIADMSELDEGFESGYPPFSFRNCPFSEAIQQIFDACGGCCLREYYTNGKSRLEAKRFGEGQLKTVTIPTSNESDYLPVSINVEPIDDIADVTDRVIGFGERAMCVVSLLSTQMSRLWDSSLEAQILENPELGSYGNPESNNQFQHVFKRYGLPPWFPRTIAKHCGGSIPTHVFKIYRDMIKSDDGAFATGDYQYDIIQSSFYFEDGYIVLGQPCVTVDSITEEEDDDGKTEPVKKYIESEFVLTVGVYVGNALHFTASKKDVQELSFAQSGMTQEFVRDDLGYVQYTNKGNESFFGGIELGCAILDGTEEPVIYTDRVIVQNDIDALKDHVNKALADVGIRSRSYAITMNRYCGGYAIGDRIRIVGQENYEHDNYSITSITHDLISNTTSLTIDNMIPTRMETGI